MHISNSLLLLGLFSSPKDANRARIHLKKLGLKKKEIMLIEQVDRVSALRSVHKHITGESALTGGLLGGLAGLLVAATPVVLPGMGLVFIGPFVILIGFVIGAVTGAVLGALVDLGISVNQIKRYKERIRDGGVLVTAPVDEEIVEEAQEVMEALQAEEQTLVPYKQKFNLRRAY